MNHVKEFLQDREAEASTKRGTGASKIFGITKKVVGFGIALLVIIASIKIIRGR